MLYALTLGTYYWPYKYLYTVYSPLMFALSSSLSLLFTMSSLNVYMRKLYQILRIALNEDMETVNIITAKKSFINVPIKNIEFQSQNNRHYQIFIRVNNLNNRPK